MSRLRLAPSWRWRSSVSGRKFINDVPLALIAVASLALTLGVGLSFFIVLALSGLIYWAWIERGMSVPAGHRRMALPGGWMLLGVFAAVSLPLVSNHLS